MMVTKGIFLQRQAYHGSIPKDNLALREVFVVEERDVVACVDELIEVGVDFKGFQRREVLLKKVETGAHLCDSGASHNVIAHHSPGEFYC
ncbi:hypothetical protein GOP47_0020648 [Adiantum capillus-veneris]|uniref:Uncharacterized protein n=1 Tax=Adiantum capillus-veneris TaxID=13818 RepID=A0A9D4UAG7_ADICA|nr:hypothetical protein GOP47_0020648 [Adiantum capillus-veneris]